jgi:cysteinyl-tRNA synthetase
MDDLVPIRAGTVGMYSCGPTVYSNLHIGNLAAFIYADVLRRAVTLSGYDVRHIMNITDVDDKTIRDSKIMYPEEDPLTALRMLTETYTTIFKNDITAVGVDTQAIEFVSAVSSIPAMITLIQRVLDANIGYIAEGGIYFSIARYTALGHTYGRLQKVDMTQSKSRIAHDEYDKDNASDFALWKAATAGEPVWDAQFTVDGDIVTMPGRPGWHIECSAMSETLGTPFDIHTGGIDLKFPHHENEIAQSVAAGAHDLAHIFVHNNHILVDGRKMSKSLGNITTLREVEARGFSPMAFRLLVLESHYHNESNFSWEILEAAANRLKKWQTWADVRHQSNANIEQPMQPSEIEKHRQALIAALEDDLATPKALIAIHSGLEQAMLCGVDSISLPHFELFLEVIKNGIGIDLMQTEGVSGEIQALLERRQVAREAKDWTQSDTLRDELATHGITVIDDPRRGQVWQRS